MPTIEDPVDDPWQGKWLKASTAISCQAGDCRYRFKPLDKSENPLAPNLPGLDYRRTLKVRLLFKSDPMIDSVQVFSGSREKVLDIRVELGAGETTAYTWNGAVQAYNGRLRSLETWKPAAQNSAHGESFHVATGGETKGLRLSVVAAEPSLPGSHDVTIVTLDAGDRTFSFAVPDVEKAPVYIPDIHAYVSL